MTKFTKDQVLSIGLDYLDKNGIDYSSKNEISINYGENEHLRDGSLKNVWVFGYGVAFFNEDRHMFLIISDDDGKILYGMHDTGYFEIKE